MTGYTARAFRLGATAAEMNGMDAQLDHATAATARNVRYTLFPAGRVTTAHSPKHASLANVAHTRGIRHARVGIGSGYA